MKPASAEITSWLDSIGPDTVVLTPNNRLSRFIQHQYGLYRQLQDRQAWSTLPCYSLNGWLQSQWEQLQQGCYPGCDRVLLNTMQESVIWERIIRDHSRGHELLQPRQTAAVAREAWHTLLQWRLDPQQISSREMDKRLFKLWAVHYLSYCVEHNLTDSSQIVTTMLQAAAGSRLPLPKTIALYGFDVVTPLLRSLLDSISALGITVCPIDMRKQAEVRRVELDDEETEILAAARWAAGLIARKDASEPLQIGIVVPQLASMRSRVERLFSSVFEPQHILISNPRHVAGFNLSAAQPLAGTPPVQAALNALQLNRQQLEIEQVSQLLRSPFIGSFTELNRRALLDVELRAEALTLSTSALRAAAGRSRGRLPAKRSAICPDLFRRLQDFNRLPGQGRGRARLPAEWAKLFTEQLQVLGWPGERSLDSQEFQQVRHWQAVLENLAGLEPVSGACDVTTALAHLHQIASQYPYHARTGTSPVQILGLMEAAGILFDHVWVMHMDNQNWPMPPQPNPLIPIRQQVELRMPRASVDAELAYARALTTRLAGSADQVIFSSSRHRGDLELRPSPLIEAYPCTTTEPLQLLEPLDYSRELYRAAAVIAEPDEQAPRITDPAAVRGGTAILRDQAACPFRSFAVHRLHARQIEQAMPGIHPTEHGMLLHRAMELIWRKLESSDVLARTGAEELEQCINQAIKASFRRLSGNRNIGRRLRDMESERLYDLISDWLELEQQRAPFRVAFHEQERELNLAGLSLLVRYDRVDELADGSLFVIDYKTGRADIGSWAGVRPDEPQVPIYCLANQERISGAAFGILKVRETGFRGIAVSTETAPGLTAPASTGLPDLPDNWQDILRHWRVVMEQLAQDFTGGAAAVDPKSTSTSCRYCDLPGLCRIAEYAAAADESETGEVDGDDS